MKPDADDYARALFEAAHYTGERSRLVLLAQHTEAPRIMRRTPLICRPLAYEALCIRFPNRPAPEIARIIGIATAAPRASRARRETAMLIAEKL